MLRTLLFLISIPLVMTAAPVTSCDALAAKEFGDDVRIKSAVLVAKKGNMPEHCDVRGVIFPEAKFALKMPTDWNERFEMVGNGGTAGTISMGAVDGAVRNRYAAVSTDTGHDAAKEPLAVFAWETPQNPNARRKFLDFAWLSVHETAVLAKKVIATYYGASPKYSYWVGCSTGGRQGLQEAQRFPEDFDGLVVGAPGLFNTGNNIRRMWVAQSQLGAGATPAEKLPLLNKAIYDKCDALDGLKDGLIDDPRNCKFDPLKDLPKCNSGDGVDCFTQAQLVALAKIYGGAKDSKGKQLMWGEPVGSELVWPDNLIAPDKSVLPRAESQVKYFMFDPAPGPDWKFTQYNFDTDPQRMQRTAAQLDARNPELGPLKQRGGKILQYSGWADQQVNPFPGIDYYETVTKKFGVAETMGFYRLFMVPGMFHCNGGPGCGAVNWLGALVEWVEQGKAPDSLVGAHVEKGVTTRTRPVCPYPQVARYKGAGSVDDAANFACVNKP